MMRIDSRQDAILGAFPEFPTPNVGAPIPVRQPLGATVSYLCKFHRIEWGYRGRSAAVNAPTLTVITMTPRTATTAAVRAGVAMGPTWADRATARAATGRGGAAAL